MTTTPPFNEAAGRKITVARAQLLLNNPFFGMLALRLNLQQSTRVPTLAVDGKTMFYNPDFVLGLSNELARSAVAHEVMHCAMDTFGRKGSRNHKRWNYATDYANNAILKDSGMEIGAGWLYNPIYKDLSAEAIYTALPEEEDHSGTPDVFDDILPGKADSQQADATEWAIAVSQAATAAQAQGKLPGVLQRFIEESAKRPLDWRAELRRFVTQRAKNDYSWSRPNKRFLPSFIMPTLYSENMGPIVIGVDTSGSIDAKTLGAFEAEIRGIVDSVRPSEIHVVYCDAVVNHVDIFTPDDELRLTPHGGGGTAFKPVFDYVEEHNINPECLVYLTDLYGDHKFDAPQYATIWCCISDVVGSFGDTLKIEV